MVADIEVYRSAQVLIREHGEDAAVEAAILAPFVAALGAAMRADAMLEKHDLEGQAVWKRIVRAVEEIERKGRREMVAL